MLDFPYIFTKIPLDSTADILMATSVFLVSPRYISKPVQTAQ